MTLALRYRVIDERNFFEFLRRDQPNARTSSLPPVRLITLNRLKEQVHRCGKISLEWMRLDLRWADPGRF
jgi:hypothetical protein